MDSIFKRITNFVERLFNRSSENNSNKNTDINSYFFYVLENYLNNCKLAGILENDYRLICSNPSDAYLRIMSVCGYKFTVDSISSIKLIFEMIKLRNLNNIGINKKDIQAIIDFHDMIKIVEIRTNYEETNKESNYESF